MPPSMLLQSTRVLGARVAAPLGVAGRPRSSATAAAAAATPLDADVASDAARSAEWERAKPFHAMPGPKPFPLLGNIPRFLPGIGKYGKVDMLDAQILLRKEYGDLVRVSNMVKNKDMVFVFDPEIVEKVFRNEGVWPFREGLDSMKYYRSVTRKERYEGAHGLVTSQGQEWQDFRTKVNQPMMQPRSASRYSMSVNDVAEDFISRTRDLRDEINELPADFITELYKWALESIALVALDTRLGCLSPTLPADSEQMRLIHAVQVIFEGFYKLDLCPSLWRIVSTPMWRRMVSAFDVINEVSEKYVNEALAKNSHSEDREPSILSRVIEKDPKVARVMAIDMLTAGVDTTSHMAAFLLLLLAKNPQVQRKVTEEVFQAIPSVHHPVTSETIAQLPYLKACFKESLRVFPITIGNIRKTMENIVLGDYQVPKGTDVLLCHMAMSRDEQHFPRPMSFEPERWLRGSAQAHTAHKFVSLPFGFGPRTCVGRRFAEMEVLTLVSKILRNFQVEYHHGDDIQFSSRTINTVTSPLKFRLIDHN